MGVNEAAGRRAERRTERRHTRGALSSECGRSHGSGPLRCATARYQRAPRLGDLALRFLGLRRGGARSTPVVCVATRFFDDGYGARAATVIIARARPICRHRTRRRPSCRQKKARPRLSSSGTITRGSHRRPRPSTATRRASPAGTRARGPTMRRVRQRPRCPASRRPWARRCGFLGLALPLWTLGGPLVAAVAAGSFLVATRIAPAGRNDALSPVASPAAALNIAPGATPARRGFERGVEGRAHVADGDDAGARERRLRRAEVARRARRRWPLCGRRSRLRAGATRGAAQRGRRGSRQDRARSVGRAEPHHA